MTLFARSPRVVGAHLYAKFGYDEALRQISTSLTETKSDDNRRFWKNVMNVLHSLNEDELEGRHPCAALNTDMVKDEARENQPAVNAERHN